MKKTILITGAGTGIGRDAAFALAGRGHRVLATTFSLAQAAELRAEAVRRNVVLEVHKLDITDAADRAQVLDWPVDVLINNAGMGESGSLAEVDMERIRRVFEVNVFATLALTQLALRGMIERRSGTVLFVSSIAGRLPMPFLMPYSMTKFALSAAAAGLREEMDQLGKGVQVAVIEPGAIHTGFNQQMSESKYAWMDEKSYFYGQVAAMKAKEGALLRFWKRAAPTLSSQKSCRPAKRRGPACATWRRGPRA
jgi:short-subunit dehydrogenase